MVPLFTASHPGTEAAKQPETIFLILDQQVMEMWQIWKKNKKSLSGQIFIEVLSFVRLGCLDSYFCFCINLLKYIYVGYKLFKITAFSRDA